MTNPVMPATGVPLDGEDIGHPDNPPDSWTQGVMAAGVNEFGTPLHARFLGEFPGVTTSRNGFAFSAPVTVPTDARAAGEVIGVATLNPSPGDLPPVEFFAEFFPGALGLLDFTKTIPVGSTMYLMLGTELGGIAPFEPGDVFDLNFGNLSTFRAALDLDAERDLPSVTLLTNAETVHAAGLNPRLVDFFAVVVAGSGYTPPAEEGTAFAFVNGLQVSTSFVTLPGS